MEYLANLKKTKSRAHIWDSGDTYCKMYSTGGMNKKKMTVLVNPNGKYLCMMCVNVWNQFNPEQLIEQDEQPD